MATLLYPPLFIVAEVISISVVSYHFVSQIGEQTPMRGVLLLATSMACTVGTTWLFWYARELLFVLLAVATPGLLKEATKTFKDTRAQLLKRSHEDHELATVPS